MLFRTVVISGVLAVTMAFASSAPAADEGYLREAQDRAAIEKLMWDYASALDSGNAEAYAALYTDDGAFGTTKGHEALKKMINDVTKSREERKAKGEPVFGTLHMTTDRSIEFSDHDHATIHYYWLTSFVAPPAAAGAKPQERVPFTGHGIDTVVRINGKWFIKNRNVQSKDW
jgi:hypothetical protein